MSTCIFPVGCMNGCLQGLVYAEDPPQGWKFLAGCPHGLVFLPAPPHPKLVTGACACAMIIFPSQGLVLTTWPPQGRTDSAGPLQSGVFSTDSSSTSFPGGAPDRKMVKKTRGNSKAYPGSAPEGERTLQQWEGSCQCWQTRGLAPCGGEGGESDCLDLFILSVFRERFLDAGYTNHKYYWRYSSISNKQYKHFLVHVFLI